jgi:hypothetical protein
MYLKIICYSLAVLLPVMYLIYMAPGDAGQAKQARKFREEIEKNEEFRVFVKSLGDTYNGSSQSAPSKRKGSLVTFYFDEEIKISESLSDLLKKIKSETEIAGKITVDFHVGSNGQDTKVFKKIVFK